MASADVFEHEWARMPPPFSEFCGPDSVRPFLERRLAADPEVFSVWSRNASAESIQDLVALLTPSDSRWAVLMQDHPLPPAHLMATTDAPTEIRIAAALLAAALAHASCQTAIKALDAFVAWSTHLRAQNLFPAGSPEGQMSVTGAIEALRATVFNTALNLHGDSPLLATPIGSAAVFAAIHETMAPHALFNLPSLRRWCGHARGRTMAVLLASDPTPEASRLRTSLVAAVLVGSHVKDDPGAWMLDVFLSASHPFTQDLVDHFPQLADHPVALARQNRAILTATARAATDQFESARLSLL